MACSPIPGGPCKAVSRLGVCRGAKVGVDLFVSIFCKKILARSVIFVNVVRILLLWRASTAQLLFNLGRCSRFFAACQSEGHHLASGSFLRSSSGSKEDLMDSSIKYNRDRTLRGKKFGKVASYRS